MSLRLVRSPPAPKMTMAQGPGGCPSVSRVTFGAPSCESMAGLPRGERRGMKLDEPKEPNRAHPFHLSTGAGWCKTWFACTRGAGFRRINVTDGSAPRNPRRAFKRTSATEAGLIDTHGGTAESHGLMKFRSAVAKSQKVMASVSARRPVRSRRLRGFQSPGERLRVRSTTHHHRCEQWSKRERRRYPRHLKSTKHCCQVGARSGPRWCRKDVR